MHILITGAWEHTDARRCAIENMGHTVSFLRYEKDPLPVPYEAVEGVICNGLFLYHPIEKFTALKYIQLTSAGLDRVPMEYVKAHGISIFNARDVYSVPMAEFALCGVLQLYKQSRFFMDKQTRRRWEKHRGLLELAGKTVCVVGCGSVGTECAKRFQVFGCRVLGVNRTVRESASYDRMYPLEQLDSVLTQADVVVLTLPLTPETTHLMNRQRFESMKTGAVLVNIARGGIVDTQALIWALNSKLGGAVLDVFEEEPLGEGSPLWQMEHVMITPHNSFVGEGNRERLCRAIMDNLERNI